MSSPRLYAENGMLVLESPFDRDLVDAIKALPYADRHWDKPGKRWLIAPQHGFAVAQMVQDHLGVVVELPGRVVQAPAAAQVRAVKLEYLGRCRMREFGGEATATGYCDGDWTLVFPELVLRAWFADAAPATPGQAQAPQTLYAVLAVRPDADLETMKRSYRQLAKAWHPDVNREPDARERFERIQRAYEILRDGQTRKRYDAGLKLEASTQQTSSRPKNMRVDRHDDDAYGYRTPLLCGWLLLEGTPRLGQFHVAKILNWADITNDRGQTMIASWPDGAKTFQVRWF